MLERLLLSLLTARLKKAQVQAAKSGDVLDVFKTHLKVYGTSGSLVSEYVVGQPYKP